MLDTILANMKQLIGIILILLSYDSLGQRIGNNMNSHIPSYSRYDGIIVERNENTFQFGENILFVTNTASNLKGIVKCGLLYPGLFGSTNSSPNDNSTKSENSYSRDSCIVVKGKVSLLFGTDSLSISDLKEVNKTLKTRQFEFLLFRKGVMNPTSLFIELTNENATEETNVETFIKGARLTRFKVGKLMI
jgi:hypothetical protein